ncbi:MAG: type III polyketide synthase [Bacteroidia bacterium]|nr:type III polyketide synthase [Bacteroidia bacterium]
MSPKPRSFITRIGTAVPAYKIPQRKAAEFMSRTVARDEETSRKVQALYRATGIRERYSVLDDFISPNGHSLFPPNEDLEPFPTTAARMDLYRREACPLAVAAVNDGLKSEDLAGITHLITVSCTGMYAPGLDIDLVKALGLSGSVERTCINFMGCYAAFNALKMADAVVKARPQARVLIVSVELCSLHLQKDNSKDQLLANSLFADGAAAVLVENQPRSGWNYSLEAFFCQLIPEGESDMAWKIIDTGFEMRLSAYVPDLLAGVADQALQSLMGNLPVSSDQIDHFALHPGGVRVLAALEKALNLPKEVNSASYHVLRHYGNMSSATVLFVLKEKLRHLQAADHQSWLLSMAFGPGLTLESGVMQIIFQD